MRAASLSASSQARRQTVRGHAFVLTGVASGAAAGALICLHDLCRHAIGLDGYLAPLAVGLYALCGAVQALLVCVLIATAWRFLARPMTPGLAIGLLCGLNILGMSVFCLTNLNALAAIVCGGILAVALARRTRLAGTCQLTDIVPTVFDVLERPSPAADLSG